MIDIDIVLLILKVGILILLYAFIWRVVRAAVGDVRRSAAVASSAPEVVYAARTPVGPAPVRPAAGRGAGADRAPHATGWTQDVDPVRLAPRLVVEESTAVTPGREFPLSGPVMVGRDPGSDIVLAETVVSGTHARLIPRGSGYAVEDAGSTNGTFVDDQRVADARLTHGSRLRIGDTVFRYEE